jgi:Domain of unknown function (DUF4177)
MTATPTRWEYKAVEVKERTMLSNKPLRQRLEELLNEHGREGWHMTGLVMADAAGVMKKAEGLIITFERPLAD